MVSNVLWTTWGWQDGALARIGLQVALAALNICGVLKTERLAQQQGDAQGTAQS